MSLPKHGIDMISTSAKDVLLINPARRHSGNKLPSVWLSCESSSYQRQVCASVNSKRQGVEGTEASRFMNSLQPPSSLQVGSIQQLPPIDISTSWLK